MGSRSGGGRRRGSGDRLGEEAWLKMGRGSRLGLEMRCPWVRGF
jgi:hypothetical protein